MNHEPLRYAHEEGHTDVCFSTDGSKFITCGADGDIRIWPSAEDTDPTHTCIGEWSLSVCQKGECLYVATGSNDVQILTFPGGERNGLLDRFVAPINQIVPSKDSEAVALAGEDMQVRVVELGAEKRVGVFDGLGGPCLSVTATSKFLAASSGDGKLRIWDVASKELVKEIACFPKTNSFANVEYLCRIDFAHNGKYLAYPENDSVVILDTSDWSQYGILKTNEVTNHYSIVQFSPCGGFLLATTLKGDFVIFNVSIKMVRGTSKHPNGTPICGAVWNPSGNGQIVYTDTQGQLGIMSDCISIKTTDDEIFTNNDLNFDDVQFESDDEDNENAISVEKLKKEVMGDVEPELNFDNASSAPTPRPKTPEIPLQAPFMPSSSPEHLNPRYLCWNHLGIVRCYGSTNDDDSGKSIEVEFLDSSFHHSMMLQNYQDYFLGTVSKAALAVANTKQLYVIPLNAGSKEWVLKLEEDATEEIVLVSASENLICFATNSYIVRVCSIFGTQRGIVSVPGPLVSMASFQNSVLVAYHSGSVRNGDQCINIKLIAFNGLSMHSCDIGAALGPESTLTWLGFTDFGTPAMVDSLGMVSLFPLSCNIWIPFCDTARHMKSPSDCFFVTAVLESYQSVVGLKCRGTAYPSFTPTPTLSELLLEPPFAEPTTDKTQLEMSLFTLSNLQVSNQEKKFSEAGLKAFALACKNNLDQRAVELMEVLSNRQLVNLSTKYALKLNKKILAEKLMEMAGRLMNDDDDSTNVVVDTPTSSPLAPKKVTLSSVKRTPKTKQVVKEVVTAPEASQESQSSILSPSLPIQEFSQESPNPFSKSARKGNESSNPLSLTDKYAGVDYVDAKENKMKNKETEKRKQPDSETDKPREKQRKLDRFMFSKRT
ncbi:WD repeat and HMG-box DNA-binding protein 1 [Tribolium castaneum]|uniref:WD repeat and HMG-box DNA-binding protein 1 n=1 Tax=Tribolium castaneum TaxID=7070 RepID=UPI0030FEECD4